MDFARYAITRPVNIWILVLTCLLGGILGGVKGAMVGVLIGGGGIVAATPGKDVELAPGTILRVRLDQPPVI